jgi:hypothetical protein
LFFLLGLVLSSSRAPVAAAAPRAAVVVDFRIGREIRAAGRAGIVVVSSLSSSLHWRCRQASGRKLT